VSSLIANSFAKLFAISTTFGHLTIVHSHFLKPGQQSYVDVGIFGRPMSFGISAVAAIFNRLFNSRCVCLASVEHWLELQSVEEYPFDLNVCDFPKRK
jgi:hypothetical protein